MALFQRTAPRNDVAYDDRPAATEIRETRPVQTVTPVDRGPQNTLTNLIWLIFGFIAVVLAMRFVFLLAGANGSNGFVSFIYSLSHVFSAPFDSIFGTTTVTTGAVNSTFQPSILVAIAVYALIAWGLTKLVNLNRRPRAVAS